MLKRDQCKVEVERTVEVWTCDCCGVEIYVFNKDDRPFMPPPTAITVSHGLDMVTGPEDESHHLCCDCGLWLETMLKFRKGMKSPNGTEK